MKRSTAQRVHSSDLRIRHAHVTRSAPNPYPPGEEMKERHEERATDDRPQDRKRITAHTENEGLGEVELPRDPRSEQSADEPDGGGHQESAARSAPSALPTAPQIAAIMIRTRSPGSVSVIRISLR